MKKKKIGPFLKSFETLILFLIALQNFFNLLEHFLKQQREKDNRFLFQLKGNFPGIDKIT